jgi:hypothetical protein
MNETNRNGHHSSAPALLKPATRRVLSLLAAVALGLATSGMATAAPPYDLHVVAWLGGPAPAGGAFTNDFEPTALNNRGQLVFTAEPETPGMEAIYLADHGRLTEIARFGQSAPGGGVFGAAELGEIGLNDAGDIAFGFLLEEGQTVFRWSHQHQTLSPVILPNVTPVPDGSGVFLGAQGSPSINNQADIAFLGNVTNPPPTSFTFVKQRTGVFVADRFGEIATVAKPGDAAPGGGTFMSAGAMYGSIFGFLFVIYTADIDMNDAGDVAFPAQISTAPNNFTGFVRRFANGVIEPVPPPSGSFTGFVSRILINNRRDLAFLASRDLASVAFGGGIGAVCLSRGGNTVSVVSLHDLAPEGGRFTTLGTHLQFNNRGDLAFTAETDTHDQAIYLYSGAGKRLRRIAGTQTTIPGVGTIIDLKQSGALSGFTALNDHGQMAFVARISDGATTRLAMVLASPGLEAD